MAKSSRSKWKKFHKRQRAQEIASIVAKRIGRLNGKLKLAANGGLSAVPMEDPETRFHFLNPEIDPKVPNTRKGLNNNYAAIERDGVDFNKPLVLAPPRSNFYGKSNATAPHRMTKEYEVINAMAPIAGHAFTLEDQRREEEEARKKQKNTFDGNEEDEGGDDAAEFVLGCNDAAGETTANVHALIAGRVNAAELSAKNKKSSKKAPATGPQRIKSMQDPSRVNNRVVVVAGDKKTKRLSDAPAARLVKSGGTAAKKKKRVVS